MRLHETNPPAHAARAAGSSELEFLCSPEGDTVAHALAPFTETCGPMVTTFYGFGDARPVSAADALITLWLKVNSRANADELTSAYRTCLLFAVHGFAPYDTDTRRRFRVLFLHQLQSIRDRLSSSIIDNTVKEVLRTGGPEIKEKEDLLALTRQICPELLP